MLMKKIIRLAFGTMLVILAGMLNSCEKFFNPEQELVIMKDNFHKDWNEYRSAELGLYSFQQKLVEQLVILGELRGDLLEVTLQLRDEALER